MDDPKDLIAEARERHEAKWFIDTDTRALIARLADALEAATQWRPIETAPRDGTPFIAAGGGLYEPALCEYLDDEDNIGAWECGYVTLNDTDNEPGGYNRPRLWLPLPPAPEADPSERAP